MPEPRAPLTAAEIDAQIDALEKQVNPENTPENAKALFVRIHERRRKRAHAMAKESQPAMHVRGSSHHDQIMTTLKAEYRQPITAADEDPGGIDYLLQTVQDCLDTGDFEDAVFAMVRVCRKAHAWNRHLGPINPEGK